MKKIQLGHLALPAVLAVSSLLAGPLAASPAESLTGDEAIEHLEETGQYESLQQAMTAARYSIREKSDSGGAWLQNPKHGLHGNLDGGGLALTVKTPVGERYTTRWELRSIAGEAIGEGELRYEGGRAEIVREDRGVTEWFVNQPDGLEHGFTLESRPASAEAILELRLGVSGDLSVGSDEGGRHIELRDGEATVAVYKKLRVWDAEGESVTARMRTAGDEVVYEVEDAGAVYPLTIDPTFTQEAYLKASNAGGLDQFGYSVSVSGDTAVVGAVGEDGNGRGGEGDNSASGAGAAYVFVRSGGVWTQEAYLKASNAGALDRFGESVSVSGDTAVVGARGEGGNGKDGEGDNSAVRAGAVYVFVRSGGAWTQEAYLKASNAEAGDLFGGSVSVSGDTAVVGAIAEDGNETDGEADNSAGDAGAAYVFVRSGGVWTQEAYLKASNAGGGDQFGGSVSISGDTAVVGARGEAGNGTDGEGDNSAILAGAAYVFVRSGGAWTQEAYLKASNAEGDDQFGISVSVSGDTAVVGANREDGNGTDGETDNSAGLAGAAYVFVRSGGAWTQEAYLKASNAGADDTFGYSVSVSGDAAVVGANGERGNGIGGESDNSASGAGAAYVFVRSGGAWMQKAYLKASNAGEFDQFGLSVSVSGDTAVVGAFGESGNGTNGEGDNSASFTGAAYVFDLPFVVVPVPTTDTPPITGPITQTRQPDLSIGTKASRLRGDDRYDRNRASQKQTITQKRRIFTTNTAKAVLKLENDGSAPGTFHFKSRGDRLPRMKVKADADGRNISAALKRGGYRTALAPGESETVVYRLRTNRFYAGVLRGGNRDDRIEFSLSRDGEKDNAAMVIKYGRPTGSTRL